MSWLLVYYESVDRRHLVLSGTLRHLCLLEQVALVLLRLLAGAQRGYMRSVVECMQRPVRNCGLGPASTGCTKVYVEWPHKGHIGRRGMREECTWTLSRSADNYYRLLEAHMGPLLEVHKGLFDWLPVQQLALQYSVSLQQSWLAVGCMDRIAQPGDYLEQ